MIQVIEVHEPEIIIEDGSAVYCSGVANVLTNDNKFRANIVFKGHEFGKERTNYPHRRRIKVDINGNMMRMNYTVNYDGHNRFGRLQKTDGTEKTLISNCEAY